MIVAAHQPHFLPWLGYLDKVRRADVFALVDHVQFERQNFQNRNRVKTRNGVQWVVVPVHRGCRDEPIREKRIDNKRDGKITWGERIFRTLENAYSRAPHFREHRDFFHRALTAPWSRLVDVDETLLRYILEQFRIATPLVRTSSLRGVAGAKSEMIASLCRALGATTYLSGSGGSRRYLDAGLFADAGIDVAWQQFRHPLYKQLEPPHGFVDRLSALDLLFNCGADSAAILQSADTAAPAYAAAG